jgi:bifunctional ADP-heptose synthase (sugar kinase/adenylyltransferase)
MRLVYSYYVLDIVHDGHLEMLRNAKAIAGPNGKLIVGILTDEAVMEKKPKPALGFNQRFRLARVIDCVDLVVAQETYSPLPNVQKIRPDILMESTSHDEETIEEAKRIMSSWGGKVVVIPYYPNESSTNIKKRIRDGAD